MLTLTIKIIEKPEGLFWTSEPDDQAHSTPYERKAARLMLIAIVSAMRAEAVKLDCPLTLMEIDDPRNKK